MNEVRGEEERWERGGLNVAREEEWSGKERKGEVEEWSGEGESGREWKGAGDLVRMGEEEGN